MLASRVTAHRRAGICDGYSYEGIREKWPETYAARKADKLRFRYPAGESYTDVIKRLESTIIEVERESESICIIGHQAILRCVYAYFMKIPSHEVRPAELRDRHDARGLQWEACCV